MYFTKKPTIKILRKKFQSILDPNKKYSKNKNLFLQSFRETPLLCIGDPENWKIIIPDTMLSLLVKWYHSAGSHIERQQQLENTISCFLSFQIMQRNC